MNTAAEPSTTQDPRREVDRWLGNYSEDHRNATNILIHWICVPAILWCVIAMFWTIPVPAWLGRPGFWAAVGMFFALAFYLRLSRPLGLAMLVLFAAMGISIEFLYRAIGPLSLLWTAIGIFVVAWIAQFIGHRIEGKSPSFLTDLAYLLIGPTWLVAKTLRKLGVKY